MQSLVNNEKKIKIDLSSIHQLLHSELAALDKLILEELHSDVGLINEVTHHIVNAGGKRLRPIIVLLMAQALGYEGPGEHYELAATIEFIHTATLLHDDVVDSSHLRRNRPTANSVWGNEASVLSGDFLYSRAFQLLSRRANIPIMTVIAKATNLLAEGEVMQLANLGKVNLKEQDYFEIITRKTAQLYAAACETAAILATQNNATSCHLAARFGLHLGIAFQLIDDLLDYTADPALSGKNLGDDLAEGKVTLPLIYTLEHGSTEQKQTVRHAITQKNRNNMDEVIETITAAKGCEYTYRYAQKEAQHAKECLQQLPNTVYYEALSQLCDFVLARHY